MIDESDLYDAMFFDLVELDGLPPDASLESMSGMPSNPGPYATPLIEQCETAWRTPFPQLTCETVLTLVGQKMGLEWLGVPAIEFARRHPKATIVYPGDMTLACLQAASELLSVAAVEMKAWLQGDFEWMDETYSWEGAPLWEARSELAFARALATPQ